MPRLPFRRFSASGLAPVLLAVIALTLAGCGRRGTLEAPPGAPGAAAGNHNAGNRLTPGLAGNTRQNAADRDPLTHPSRNGEEEDEPPIPAPNRPFILDPIL